MIGALLILLSSGAADGQETDVGSDDLSRYYGFSGIELFESHARAFNLLPGDFTDDGLTDLLIADNRSSAVRLMRQRTAEQMAAAAAKSAEVNDLQSDRRFEVITIPVDKQIAGMTSGDFNRDGLTDIAYVGVPDRLIIRFQSPRNKQDWTKSWSVRLPDLAPTSWMVDAADLNADGLTDIAVIGEDVTYLVHQAADGEMAAPQRIINTSPRLSLLTAEDVSGDGRADLCYSAGAGSDRFLCVRLQTSEGRIGPEYSFRLQQPRSVTIQDVDELPGAEILTVDSRTGRMTVWKLEMKGSDDGAVPERLVQFGIGSADSRRGTAFAAGDMNGDNLTDVVVADPDRAQILVYRQDGIDGLGPADAFPSYLKVTDVAVIPQADGPDSLLVLSEEEGLVGLASYRDGRLTFPRTLFAQSDNHELQAVFVHAHSETAAQIVIAEQSGSGRSAKLKLHRLQQSESGEWSPVGEATELAGHAGSRGVSLMTMHVNGDDIPDLLVVPNGSSGNGMGVCLAAEDGTLTEAPEYAFETGSGSAGSLFVNDRMLLSARDSFVRMLIPEEGGGWRVADQVNAGESAARVEGVCLMELNGDPSSEELLLIDGGVRRIRVLQQEGGLYRPWKECQLGSLRYSSSAITDLNGDGRPDLMLAGPDRFGIMYNEATVPGTTEVTSFESDRDDAFLADLIVGDINGDAFVDITAIDTSIDGLAILQYGSEGRIAEATNFRVFEEKRLVTDSDSRGTEPRECCVADVTGDGRNDLILLCHDRIIVYPQDTGQAAAPPQL